jgi:C-terminal processing protease CtpA/Prc
MRFTLAVICVVVFCSASGCRKNVVQAFPTNYVGVGVELTMREDRPVIVRTIAGGPAAAAGLLPEDQLLQIDDTSTAGMGLADVVVRLRGLEGTSVHVTLRRHGIEIATNIVRSSMHKEGDDYAPKLRAAAK